MENKIYLHALGLIEQIGSKRIELLKKYFPSLKEAWRASNYDLRKAGLTEKVIAQFFSQRNNLDPEKEFAKIDPEIKLISLEDSEYPASLKNIYDPPQLLYSRGEIGLLKEKCLAVVGSRAMSDYGQRACQDLVEQIPLVIISGLAVGIDSCAHQAAKDRTIAVLGSGINEDCIFPAANRKLAGELSLVISEYAPYLKARREFFPMRNRIISGLSLGVLVIEAAERSGALITAAQALEQNRSVLAVPGTIYSQKSRGTNRLIQQGAKLVQTGQDILDELELDLTVNQKLSGVKNSISPEEEIILKNLDLEPINLDKIVKCSRLTPARVFSNLTKLELKGVIKNLGNNTFILWGKN